MLMTEWCPKCGGEMVERGAHLVCKSCGHKIRIRSRAQEIKREIGRHFIGV
jgi:tRNA(Ile2) C34 agmatinyltransferase TiaS